jgi:hypothetical protein
LTLGERIHEKEKHQRNKKVEVSEQRIVVGLKRTYASRYSISEDIQLEEMRI